MKFQRLGFNCQQEVKMQTRQACSLKSAHKDCHMKCKPALGGEGDLKGCYR